MVGGIDELRTAARRWQMSLGGTACTAKLDTDIERHDTDMEVLVRMVATSEIGTAISCDPIRTQAVCACPTPSGEKLEDGVADFPSTRRRHGRTVREVRWGQCHEHTLCGDEHARCHTHTHTTRTAMY